MDRCGAAGPMLHLGSVLLMLGSCLNNFMGYVGRPLLVSGTGVL